MKHAFCAIFIFQTRSSVAGALSGAIGGEGANKGQVLTRMLKTSKKR